MEQLDKEELFFRYATEYYPKSASALESMADFHLQKNEKTKAISYLEKAYQLSGDKAYQTRVEELKKK